MPGNFFLETKIRGVNEKPKLHGGKRIRRSSPGVMRSPQAHRTWCKGLLTHARYVRNLSRVLYVLLLRPFFPMRAAYLELSWVL